VKKNDDESQILPLKYYEFPTPYPRLLPR
jgi:hypothetical protein